MREIGLGEEVLCWKVVAKNLRSLKVNVRKLVPVKNNELENWCEKLSGWMKKIVIQEKFEGRKLVRKTSEKISK